MNKYLRRIVAFVFVILLNACSSKEECILDVAKNAKTEYAAKIGYVACDDKYD